MDNVVFQAPFKLFAAKIMSGWQLDVVNVSSIEYTSLRFRLQEWDRNWYIPYLIIGSSSVYCKHCLPAHSNTSSGDRRNQCSSSSKLCLHHIIAQQRNIWAAFKQKIRYALRSTHARCSEYQFADLKRQMFHLYHMQASYFSLWWSTKRGLSKLALMYSLPYVMMIWG